MQSGSECQDLHAPFSFLPCTLPLSVSGQPPPVFYSSGLVFRHFELGSPLLPPNMPGISLADTISSLSVNDEWGPEDTIATTLDGVPYAPYSKSDKLGRMADWTQEGKEGRDRGGRQYGRNFRGKTYHELQLTATNSCVQINKYTGRAHPHYSLCSLRKTKQPSP